MDWFKTIKWFYSDRLWSKSQVDDAVVKGKITAEQYKEITGEEYEESQEIPN